MVQLLNKIHPFTFPSIACRAAAGKRCDDWNSSEPKVWYVLYISTADGKKGGCWGESEKGKTLPCVEFYSFSPHRPNNSRPSSRPSHPRTLVSLRDEQLNNAMRLTSIIRSWNLDATTTCTLSTTIKIFNICYITN